TRGAVGQWFIDGPGWRPIPARHMATIRELLAAPPGPTYVEEPARPRRSATAAAPPAPAYVEAPARPRRSATAAAPPETVRSITAMPTQTPALLVPATRPHPREVEPEVRPSSSYPDVQTYQRRLWERDKAAQDLPAAAPPI